MKYLNFSTKQFPLILGAIALFSSCKKVENYEPIGSAGQTIVRLIDANSENNTSGKATVNLNLLSTTQKVGIVRILREVPSNDVLNQAMTVIVKNDPAAVTAYNTAHGTTYVPLPAASYTVDPSTPLSGGNYTVTFAPGEFAKEIKFILPNAAGLDLNLSYAFGFTITSADAPGKISGDAKAMIVEVGVKNNYDGIYSVVSGFVQRYTGPGTPDVGAGLLYSGSLAGADDVIMFTTSANSVGIPINGQPGMLEWAATSLGLGVAGIDGVKIAIDPATNLTTATSSGYSTSNATFGNWAGHTNDYNPATKTFRLAFKWTSTAPAYREYEIVLKYKGPR